MAARWNCSNRLRGRKVIREYLEVLIKLFWKKDKKTFTKFVSKGNWQIAIFGPESRIFSIRTRAWRYTMYTYGICSEYTKIQRKKFRNKTVPKKFEQLPVPVTGSESSQRKKLVK